MKRNDDLVTASEIGQWAWCPESWRLESLGAESANRAALARGGTHHARKSAFEVLSGVAISLGWWLLAVGLLLLAFVLVGG